MGLRGGGSASDAPRAPPTDQSQPGPTLRCRGNTNPGRRRGARRVRCAPLGPFRRWLRAPPRHSPPAGARRAVPSPRDARVYPGVKSHERRSVRRDAADAVSCAPATPPSSIPRAYNSDKSIYKLACWTRRDATKRNATPVPHNCPAARRPACSRHSTHLRTFYDQSIFLKYRHHHLPSSRQNF